MIDLHSHILWGVDDGPQTIKESLQILEQAVNEGITMMAATSHYQHPLYSASFHVVYDKVNRLNMELTQNNIPIELCTGHEVRLSHQLLSLYDTRNIHTLANSNYLLIELPSNWIPLYTFHVIEELVNAGITPIIAHPERNKDIFENPQKLEKLIERGAVTQMTAGSLAGAFGRTIQTFSLHLIQANCIHTYGSDVHNMTTRAYCFQKGLSFLERKKQSHHVEMLLENNKRVVRNKPLTILKPEHVNKRRWWLNL